MEAKGIATMTALVVGIMFMMQLVIPGIYQRFVVFTNDFLPFSFCLTDIGVIGKQNGSVAAHDQATSIEYSILVA